MMQPAQARSPFIRYPCPAALLPIVETWFLDHGYQLDRRLPQRGRTVAVVLSHGDCLVLLRPTRQRHWATIDLLGVPSPVTIQRLQATLVPLIATQPAGAAYRPWAS
jgi:hypothetical protein